LSVAAGVVTAFVTLVVAVALLVLIAAPLIVPAAVLLVGGGIAFFCFNFCFGYSRSKEREIAKMKQKVSAFVVRSYAADSTIGNRGIKVLNVLKSEVVNSCVEFREKYREEYARFTEIKNELEASKTNTDNPEKLRNQERKMSIFLENHPFLGEFFLQMEQFMELKIEENTSGREVIMQAAMLLELYKAGHGREWHIMHNLTIFLSLMEVNYEDLERMDAPMEWNLLFGKK
jgi:hypothetical protein